MLNRTKLSYSDEYADYTTGQKSTLAMDWRESVEGFTADELWEMLGLTEKRLPFFNSFIDGDGLRDPWDEAYASWFVSGTGDPTLEALTPRWHQLAAIYGIVCCWFENKSVLLTHEVGVGKMLQVVGAIVILRYFREFYDEHHTFPGVFGTFLV